MMKITVSKKMSHNPFGYEEFDMQSTGASSLSVTTEGSNEVSSLHPPSSSSSSSSRKNTSCTSTPKSAAASSSSSSSSPPPEQQQQQQQQQSFRFQGLYKLLGKNNNSNNDKTDASRALLSGGDDVDVVDHEKTVDHVLSGMAESPEQARDLLRGIVADLLRENDSLKARLTEKEKALQSTQEEYNIVKEEYTDRLISIKKTVERSIGGGSCGFEIIPNAINNNNNNGSSISKSSSTDASSKNALHVISPEQATDMVIQALSNKVEQLSVEKETLEQDLKQTSERMEDLESINETRLFKIEALESQFRSINNKTRLNTGQPNIKASCRRQGADSSPFEVTLPSRAITPRSTSSNNSSHHHHHHQPTVTPSGPTTDTGMSPVKKTKKPAKTPQQPTKSKKMSRSTPRRPLILTDVNSFIEIGPGMGEI